MNNIDYDPEIMEKDEYGNLHKRPTCPMCAETLEVDRKGGYCTRCNMYIFINPYEIMSGDQHV